MNVAFDPLERMIRIPTRVWGPSRQMVALLLLDTGAEGTVINSDFMRSIGYDVVTAPSQVELTTVTGKVVAPRFIVPRIEAFQHHRTNYGVTAFTAPPRVGVDGILGIDFFLGRKLTIDFRIGLVTLE